MTSTTMIQSMKRLTLTLLLILALILSGCTEDGVNANEVDLSSYPSSVQDGTVSVEYYEQINKYYEAFGNYTKLISLKINSSEEDDESVDEAIFNFVQFLMDMKVEPTSEADKEIAKYFNPVLEKSKDAGINLGMYSKTKEEFHLAKSTENFEDLAYLREKLDLVMDKYLLSE